MSKPISDLEWLKFVNKDTLTPSVRVTDSTITQRSQLAQARPLDVNTVSIFNVSSGEIFAIASIVICNTSGLDTTYRVFHDNDGSTYDESTALFWDADIRANSSHTIEIFLAMDNSTGNLAIKSGASSALTFTLYGAKFQS